MKPERIQKIISNYGQFSRRQVEDFIVKGLVKVNGETATLGDKATIDDAITVKGNRITFKTRHDYYVLNKPKGYICAREDKMGRTAVSLIDNPQKRNLFTIGRLDVGTTGLIIITSDGELANRINSPSSKIKKTYLVWVNTLISKADQIKLQKGVTLANGYTTQPLAGFKPLSFGDNESSFKMVLTEGKQNQIKKMFQALDSEVINLKRVQIGQMKIDSLPTGQYAKYTKEKLFQLLGIT